MTFTVKMNGENRKSPYTVKLHEHKLKSEKKVKVVFGQAANKPFDTIHYQQKIKIGKMLCPK